MMNSRLFPRKDEIILSTITVLIVGALFYQGFAALFQVRDNAMFQKETTVVTKKELFV